MIVTAADNSYRVEIDIENKTIIGYGLMDISFGQLKEDLCKQFFKTHRVWEVKSFFYSFIRRDARTGLEYGPLQETIVI